MEDLVQLRVLVDACSATNSSNEKKVLLKKLGTPIKRLLKYVYNPYYKYFATSKNVEKYIKNDAFRITRNELTGLYGLLDGLRNRVITGNAALSAIAHFVETNPEYKELVFRIINKNLKIKVGLSVILKVFHGLVPKFTVALADDLGHPKKPLNDKYFETHKKRFWASRKLDGVRTLFRCENGEVTCYARSGNVFPWHIQGLSKFQAMLKGVSGVIDGEMVVLDDDGNEHFNIANSIMNTRATKNRGKNNLKLADDQYLCYFAFDLIELDVFDKGFGGLKWSHRQEKLDDIIVHHNITNSVSRNCLVFHRQVPYDHADSLWNEALEKSWEGLIYRLDAPYKGKRSRDILKRKMYLDEEFKVERLEFSMQMVPGSTLMEPALKNVHITYYGNDVAVGGGFTWEQRKHYVEYPDELVGSTVKVRYNLATTNKAGTSSLRHPRVLAIYQGVRDT